MSRLPDTPRRPATARAVPATLRRHIVRQLTVTTLVAVAALCGPLVLLTLLDDVPSKALSNGFAWPALVGIAPTALYLTLPMAVGLAVTWTYARLCAEGTVAVLYGIGVSPLAIARPALRVAAPAMLIGLAVACLIAPRSISRVQDVLYMLRNTATSALMDARVFYAMDNGRYVMQFGERLPGGRLGHVFFREVDSGGEEHVIVSREASLDETGGARRVSFRDGTMQTARPDGDVRIVSFQTLQRQMGEGGTASAPTRRWRGLFERSTGAFLRARLGAEADPAQESQWRSEAVKRFGVPLLAVGHALTGIALLLWFGRLSGRATVPLPLFCLFVPVAHCAMLLAAEGAVYLDVRLVWAVVAAILAEIVGPVLAILALQRNRRRPAGRPRMPALALARG